MYFCYVLAFTYLFLRVLAGTFCIYFFFCYFYFVKLHEKDQNYFIFTLKIRVKTVFKISR